jgi:hypothetical protein
MATIQEDFFDQDPLAGKRTLGSWADRVVELLSPHDTTAAEDLAGVTPVNFQYPNEESGNIFTRYNGSIAQAAATNTTALQAALDSQQTVEIRGNGTHNFSDTIKLNDNNVIEGRGQGTVLKWNVTGKSLVEGKTKATLRQYRCGLRNLMIDNTARSNASAIGVDLSNITDAVMYNVISSNVATGFYGVSAGGAFQNALYKCLASTVVTAMRLGTLTNEWKMFDFRVADATDGVIIDDNTGHKFYAFQCETFTGTAVIIGSTTTSQYNLFDGVRIEGGVNGFNLHATRAQATVIVAPQFTTISGSNFVASGNGTVVLSPDYNSPSLQTNRVEFGQGAIDNANWAQLYAVSNGVLALRNASDSGYAMLDADILQARTDVRILGAAQTVGAGEISIGSDTQTTIGAAGGASALPATPTGYLIVNIAGTNRIIPYYAAS